MTCLHNNLAIIITDNRYWFIWDVWNNRQNSHNKQEIWWSYILGIIICHSILRMTKLWRW